MTYGSKTLRTRSQGSRCCIRTIRARLPYEQIQQSIRYPQPRHCVCPRPHDGSNISALNQSREGCDWNNCHIMSSFHEEGIIPVVPLLPPLFKISGPLLKSPGKR
jgi:hypothetical protein